MNSVKFNFLIKLNTKDRPTASTVPPLYQFLIWTAPSWKYAAAEHLALPKTCQPSVDVTTERKGRWGGGDWRLGWSGWQRGVYAHTALLMGTQCAERQEAAHSSRQHCHHRGWDKVGGWERGEEKRRRKGHYSPTLFIFYPWQAHRHNNKSIKLTRALIDTHARAHSVICRQTKMHVERGKWARHRFTHAAWLSESPESQASIQFIRER